MPIREVYAHNGSEHRSPYGQAKYWASRAVSTCSMGVALRFFNIYGPRQDPGSPYSGVISRFVESARTGRPLTVHGDGSQSRDFVHVSDCVSAYLAAAGLHPRLTCAQPGCYNIGTGKGTTILELAQIITSLSGSTSRIASVPPRAGDIPHSLANIEAFVTATGWQTEVSLEAGLRGLLES